MNAVVGGRSHRSVSVASTDANTATPAATTSVRAARRANSDTCARTADEALRRFVLLLTAAATVQTLIDRVRPNRKCGSDTVEVLPPRCPVEVLPAVGYTLQIRFGDADVRQFDATGGRSVVGESKR